MAIQSSRVIQMSVLSADLNLLGFKSDREITLSCDLVNIAKGNCTVILRPISSSISGFIDIFIDRPIMKAEINVTPLLFDQVHNSFNIDTSRNIKLYIVIEDNLDINNEGVLIIDKPINSKIVDLTWTMPLR